MEKTIGAPKVKKHRSKIALVIMIFAIIQLVGGVALAVLGKSGSYTAPKTNPSQESPLWMLIGQPVINIKALRWLILTDFNMTTILSIAILALVPIITILFSSMISKKPLAIGNILWSFVALGGLIILFFLVIGFNNRPESATAALAHRAAVALIGLGIIIEAIMQVILIVLSFFGLKSPKAKVGAVVTAQGTTTNVTVTTTQPTEVTTTQPIEVTTARSEVQEVSSSNKIVINVQQQPVEPIVPLQQPGMPSDPVGVPLVEFLSPNSSNPAAPHIRRAHKAKMRVARQARKAKLKAAKKPVAKKAVPKKAKAPAGKKNEKKVRIEKKNGLWAIKKGKDAKKATKVFTTQKQAINHAKSMKQSKGKKIIVQSKKGKTRKQ